MNDTGIPDSSGAPAPAMAPAAEPAGGSPSSIDMESAVTDIGDALLDSLGVEGKEKEEALAGEKPDDSAAPAKPDAAKPDASKTPPTDPKAAAPGTPPAKPAEPAKPEIDPATGKPKIPSNLPNGLPQEFRTWRPEAQALLLKAQADPALKPLFEEALKREQDMDKGISQYREAAGFAEVFRKTLQPFMPLMQHHNLDPMREVGQLLQFRSLLALGTPEQKVGLLRTIAKNAGVSFEALGAEEPAIDPTVAALQKELADVKSQTLQQQEALRAERTAQLRTELEAFAADPANKYFDEVAGEIPRLIKSGLAKGYKDGYELACRLSPVVQAREQQRIKDEAAAELKAKQEAEAAARAKAKSANVTSSAKNRSAAAPVGSIEDTLKETFREINSRAS